MTDYGVMAPAAELERAAYPFDKDFYERLIASRDNFSLVSRDTTTTVGHGFRVSAGQAFRLTLLEANQIVDICFANADDPSEHFFTGAQVHIEGGSVTRGVRLWGTPPRSRPIATCIADSLSASESPRHDRNHGAFGAHCNAHLWYLWTGSHHRPCYDNLRYGFAMLGFDQHAIHDNVNLFQKLGFDPYSGAVINGEGDAVKGDYIEFYAEIDLAVVMSVCPAGPASDGLDVLTSGGGLDIEVNPIGITIYETGMEPLGEVHVD